MKKLTIVLIIVLVMIIFSISGVVYAAEPDNAGWWFYQIASWGHDYQWVNHRDFNMFFNELTGWAPASLERNLELMHLIPNMVLVSSKPVNPVLLPPPPPPPPAGIFDGIIGFFADIVNLLNPLHERFFLRIALVPSPDYFNNQFTVLRTNLESRLPIIAQLGYITDSIISSFSAGGSSVPPAFYITYMGIRMRVIDFSFFIEYRSLVHGFIIVIAYTFFVFRLLKKLPKIIH